MRFLKNAPNASDVYFHSISDADYKIKPPWLRYSDLSIISHLNRLLNVSLDILDPI